MENLVKVYQDDGLQWTVKLFVNKPNVACAFISPESQVTFLITWTVNSDEIQQKHSYKKAKEHFTNRKFDSFKKKKVNIIYSFDNDWLTGEPVFSCTIKCFNYRYGKKIFRKIRKLSF